MRDDGVENGAVNSFIRHYFGQNLQDPTDQSRTEELDIMKPPRSQSNTGIMCNMAKRNPGLTWLSGRIEWTFQILMTTIDSAKFILCWRWLALVPLGGRGKQACNESSVVLNLFVCPEIFSFSIMGGWKDRWHPWQRRLKSRGEPQMAGQPCTGKPLWAFAQQHFFQAERTHTKAEESRIPKSISVWRTSLGQRKRNCGTEL